mmetsp:Transcript_18103/g.13146  ORF Transcript_18103/g.13146 Transcript_18103/m.13146 type:complete len:112 (-) Transcript_18103:258-593(-)
MPIVFGRANVGDLKSIVSSEYFKGSIQNKIGKKTLVFAGVFASVWATMPREFIYEFKKWELEVNQTTGVGKDYGIEFVILDYNNEKMGNTMWLNDLLGESFKNVAPTVIAL